jgi:hypothetical protein
MIVLKYNKQVSKEDYIRYIRKIKNDVFKLRPLKEEGLEWEKHLNTILVELGGFYSLGNESKIITTMSKLEALHTIDDFMIYRKTIFETLSILDGLE